jgi:hypothetical protein
MAEPTESLSAQFRAIFAGSLDAQERALAMLAVVQRVGVSRAGARRLQRMLQSADSLMGRLLAREFERRIAALEFKVTALEGRK